MMKSNEGYNPLTFFWIATYRDGTALSQFDPETGRENLFKQVELSKLDTFGWYPFSFELAGKIGFNTHVNSNLPRYTIKLGDSEKLVAFKRQYIRYGLSEGEKSRETVYVLGYKDGVKLFIDEDGNVTVSSDE